MEDHPRSAMLEEIRALEAAATAMARAHAGELRLEHPDHRADATNLLHYLALRQHDVRHLQRQLGELGLSSLGRCEPYVLATLRSVRAALDSGAARAVPDALSFDAGRQALDRNTDALFGSRPPGRVPRVMVTLPSEAAWEFGMVRELVASGMDVARINGAHDDEPAWLAMAEHVRRASAETGRPCRISIDLPGPKLRTGPIADGPRVLRLRPQRDSRGVAVVPATLWLVPAQPALPGPGAGPGRSLPVPAVPVDPAWLGRRRVGDRITLRDTRGSPRVIRVTGTADDLGMTAAVLDTTYLETGTELRCGGDRTVVGDLPPVAQYHLLAPDDRLVLTRDLAPAEPWQHGQPGTARIGCTLAAAFDAVRPGDRVALDDGKITGIVERTSFDEFRVRVTGASPGGSRLRAGRGINLPGSDLQVPVVSEADTALLRVAAAHADMVGLSFVRSEGDVDAVRDRLHDAGADDLGLVVKVETTAAFARLPEILLHAMRSRRVGVMIARGDLAVEAGYERLAEVQEEIMWLCEAAHLPVVWATEVLDRLARTGKLTRAEVTDAAMAQRAECVMLNKGPHVVTAIEVLDDILRRMAGHQRKKTPLLRPLRSWEGT